MTVTLDIPEELEAGLANKAQCLGLSLDEYILHILTSVHMTNSTLKTGAELVAYWEHQGLIGTRSNNVDSPAHARQIRKQAEHRLRT